MKKLACLLMGTMLAVLTAVSGPALAAPASDGAASESTGGNSGVGTLAPLTAQQAAIVSAKLAAVSALDASSSGSSGGLSASTNAAISSTPNGAIGGDPAAFSMGTVDHEEGQGNPCTVGTTGCTPLGHPDYTCAAASTRNMTDMMGSTDHSEATFVGWEDISQSDGLLDITYVANTLNKYFKQFGGWTVAVPSSSTNYLNSVVTDTYNYNSPVIQNVQTSYLPYFGGHSLEHYDVVYGYNQSNNTVAIDEEWNPVFTWGTDSDYSDGNPYGLQPAVPASAAYNAVIHSKSQHFVL